MMKFIVITVLLITSLAINLINDNEKLKKRIAARPLRYWKNKFVALSLVFITASMTFSEVIGESLPIARFRSPYSTGIWATLYISIVYLFLFHDFQLNWIIISKEKKWSAIEEHHLVDMAITTATFVVGNKMSKENSAMLISMMIRNLNRVKAHSVVKESDVLTPNEYKSHYYFFYNEERYFVEEERINQFFQSVIEFIELKRKVDYDYGG